jgi:ribose 5-phosphate isomerase B
MEHRVVAIASDHAGFELKTQLSDVIRTLGHEVLDLGTRNTDSVDYPDFGHAIAHAIVEGQAAMGVAICGSGVGISIAANRHKGIRAALCADGLTAALARRHNDANVLCLGSRLIGIETAKDCVNQFFATAFEGGRHQPRIVKLDR